MPLAVTPVPVEEVTLEHGFWHDRIQASRRVGLPALLERFEEQGVLDNFRRRAGKDTPRRGWWFTDSDLYKWMEAAAWWVVQDGDDSTLRGWLDQTVEVVLGAQSPSGYLNTNFGEDERFANLDWSHELYCLGHLIEAAIAHRRATGDGVLVDAARRFSALAERELATRDVSDGHPGVELALVALARETGEERWVALAAELCRRVKLPSADRLAGHAVRALYFSCALADLAGEERGAGERGDDLDAVMRQWRSMLDSQSYVTGAVGGRWLGESVGRAFELPHEGSYAETCASVAAAMWAQRMLALTGDAACGDQVELVLHNGVLGGVSLGGDEWFYANPLATAALPDADPWASERFEEEMAGPLPLQRRGWRDVTCCPPNVLRTMASLPGRVYGASGDDLWVHLFVSSSVRHGAWVLRQSADIPWGGRVALEVDAAPGAESSLRVRVPAWSDRTSLRVNGEEIPVSKGTFAGVTRRWKPGDRIDLVLDTSPHLVVANPRVAETRGSAAIRRGPLLYCLEGLDHPGLEILDVAVRPGTLSAGWREDLLGGVMAVTADGTVPVQPWGPLYRRLEGAEAAERPVGIVAVPYYAWANRGLSPMTLWVRRVQ